MEEELFYLTLKAARSEELKDLVREAIEGHKGAKTLLTELGQMQPEDEQYDAKGTVLREYVLHHVKEEEKEMFAQAQRRKSPSFMEQCGMMRGQ